MKIADITAIKTQRYFTGEKKKSDFKSLAFDQCLLPRVFVFTVVLFTSSALLVSCVNGSFHSTVLSVWQPTIVLIKG